MARDNRRFQRIAFDAAVQFTVDDGTDVFGRIIDISLKGALIQLDPGQPALTPGQRGELTIVPTQGDIRLQLTVEVAFALADAASYGLNLISFDIESAGHLRRLVEVNLGDETLLQRELSNLVQAMESEH